MNITDLTTSIKSLAENDQSITTTDINTWMNAAINKINIACQCKIPVLTNPAGTYIPEFDERYHDALVLFSVARYRESDSDYGGAQYFMGQFENMLLNMQRDMVIKPSIRTDYNVQQIVVADDAIFTYDLLMPSGSYYDRVVVYKNDVELTDKNYSFSSITKKITFKGITLPVSTKITIVFENNSDLNNPPYEWWSF